MTNEETLTAYENPLTVRHRHRMTNEEKASIIAAVRMCNGITIRDISNKVNLPYQNVRTFVTAMVEQGVLERDREYNARYYIAGSDAIPRPQDSILEFVKVKPGCNIKQIAFITGFPYNYVRKHVMIMIADGRLNAKGSIGYQRLYVAEGSA